MAADCFVAAPSLSASKYKPARAPEEQSDTQILPTIADRSQERGGESSQPAFEM